MIWVPPQFRGIKESTSTYTLNVLRVWDNLHKNMKWEFNSILMPLTDTDYFPPGKNKISGRWFRKEDTQLREVLVEGELRPLKDLIEKKGDIFIRIDEWKYHQLKCFIGNLPKPLR
ncbi:unnamed protein product, partial [Staurois parvus]